MDPMIMGSETEYGLQVVKRLSNGETEPITRAAALGYVTTSVIKAVQHLFSENVFGKNVSEGIQDDQEHDLAHDLSNQKLSLGARLQRRGFTGFTLPNAARYYLDCHHPEYSTPETTNPYDALLHEKAGEKIVELCRRHAEERISQETPIYIRMDKNNTDGKQHAYSGHENYSLSPETFLRIKQSEDTQWDCDLRPLLITFLVTRQIITGAGKVGSELPRGHDIPYQISQRADFIQDTHSRRTTRQRPIINLRDTAYADRTRCRRLHVIAGDSNMSQLSIFLKFGITALFLRMLEDGIIENADPLLTKPLQKPVTSYRFVSQDLSLRKPLRFRDGLQATALEVQERYCDLAESYVLRMNLLPAWHDVVRAWRGVLDGLASSSRMHHEWSGNLDWVKKEFLLINFCERKHIDFLDPQCVSFDIQYHNLNPDVGVYFKVEKRGVIATLFSEEQILRACSQPPHDTRAWFRSSLAQRFSDCLHALSWDCAMFSDHELHMGDPRHGTHDEAKHLFEGNPPFEVFFERLQATINQGGLPGYTLSPRRQRIPFWLLHESAAFIDRIQQAAPTLFDSTEFS